MRGLSSVDERGIKREAVWGVHGAFGREDTEDLEGGARVWGRCCSRSGGAEKNLGRQGTSTSETRRRGEATQLGSKKMSCTTRSADRMFATPQSGQAESIRCSNKWVHLGRFLCDAFRVRSSLVS